MTTFLISTEAYSYDVVAESESEAVQLFVQDAGYSDVENAAAVLGQTVEEFLASLDIKEAP